MHDLTRFVGPLRFGVLVLLLAAFAAMLGNARAQAPQEPWELRVCADPANGPVSSRDGTGFENRVADIVADELGAYVTYRWTDINDYAVRTELRPGACDVILSVAESAGNMLNTVAWYRMPFAFVYRADAEVVPGSMLDPVMAEIDVGVSPNGLLNKVLYDLDLADSFVGVSIDRAERGLARYQPLVDAVREELVDVAIFEASFAAEHVARSDGELAFSVVTPEFVPPFSQMFRVATMGVRAEDQALRDALNRAIAARFDDIQAIFDDMGIPTLAVPQPIPPQPVDDPPLRIGLLAPIPTGTDQITDVAAEAAFYGSRVGDEIVSRVEGRGDTPVEVLFASTPSPAAAVRAVDRLAATYDVSAVVGGIGAGQAEAIARAAGRRDMLFLNVGDGSDALRGAACFPTTFHVAPSDAMYADALAAHYGDQDVFIVHHESAADRARAERIAWAWGSTAGNVVGSAGVPTGPMAYGDVLDDVRVSGADAVVVALGPADLEFFLTQIALERVEVDAILFPDAVNQTRSFSFRLRGSAPDLVDTARVVAWDPTLEEGGAADVALRFHARSGQPMDPTGWAAYAAVEVVADAYAATGSREATDLAAYLQREGVTFDVLKGEGTGFRSWSHQLRQPLYLVTIDPDAAWDQRVSIRVELAEVVGRIPEVGSDESVVEAYDRFGNGPSTTTCQP